MACPQGESTYRTRSKFNPGYDPMEGLKMKINSHEIKPRADLTGADLTRADLTGANLTGADLYRANLTGANLTRANYPISAALLAQWGSVSDELCRQLMRLDAEALPGGSAAMTAWTKNGPCPLDAVDGNYGRVANFKEKKSAWQPGRPWSLWRIWKQLAKEKNIKISGVKK